MTKFDLAIFEVRSPWGISAGLTDVSRHLLVSWIEANGQAVAYIPIAGAAIPLDDRLAEMVLGGGQKPCTQIGLRPGSHRRDDASPPSYTATSCGTRTTVSCQVCGYRYRYTGNLNLDPDFNGVFPALDARRKPPPKKIDPMIHPETKHFVPVKITGILNSASYDCKHRFVPAQKDETMLVILVWRSLIARLWAKPLAHEWFPDANITHTGSGYLILEL